VSLPGRGIVEFSEPKTMYEKTHIAAECCCHHNGESPKNGSLSTTYILSLRHILKKPWAKTDVPALYSPRITAWLLLLEIANKHYK